VLSCRGSRQTGRSLGPLEVSTYLSIGRRLDISSPLILLHENGYKFIAPTNDSADLRLILAELRGKIESVGKGDLNVSVGFGNRIDEIGDLGRSFNQMVKELGANREEVARIHRVQMSSAECLATIGELAAGLAHEIRNPLAGVAGVIEIVGRDLPVTSPTRTAIQHARLSIVQISRILTDLLQTARPHLPEIRPMDLNIAVECAVELARQQSLSLPIWIDFMKRALAGRASVPFDVPPGITFADIDPDTGKLAGPSCPRVLNEAFLVGTEPVEVCPLHR